jgi:hypothetical protein
VEKERDPAAQQLVLRPTFDDPLTSMPDDEAVETLSQLFPNRSRADLARYLAASQNNVERAFAAIERGSLDHRVGHSDGPRKKRKRTRSNDDAGRIGAWLAPPPPLRKTSEDPAVLVLDDSDSDAAAGPPPPPLATRRDAGPAVKSAFDLLKAPPREGDRATTTAPASHVNLPPLTLRTADMVAKHTGGLVTLVENALPPELASRLYVKMVKESLGEGEGENPCAFRNFAADAPGMRVNS